MYRLFLGQNGLSYEPEDSHFERGWIERCPNGSCLDLILQHQLLNSGTFSAANRLELAVRVDPFENDIKCSDFLRCVGLRESDTRLASLKTKNGVTILHQVAQHIQTQNSWPCFREKDVEDWVRLGIHVLRNGAELSAVAHRGFVELFGPVHLSPRQSEALAKFKCPLTPLRNVISFRLKEYCKESFWAECLLESVHAWAQILQQAGVDLLDYCRKENEIWKQIKCQNNSTFVSKFFSATQRCEVEHVSCGSTPAEWSLICRNVWTVPIWKLQILPGGFSTEDLVPSTIMWDPTPEEKEEGIWKMQTEKELLSDPIDLKDLCVKVQEPFTKLIDGTQDDSSLVVLMEYRRSHRKCSSSRSRSQPPLSTQRTIQDTIHRSAARSWSDGYHICRSDSRWRLDCANNAWDSREPGPRECVSTKSFFSSQESRHWCWYSYLAEIAMCQEGFQGLPSSRIVGRQWLKHTGHSDCPQGCSKVDLRRLHVPTSLRSFHPRGRP